MTDPNATGATLLGTLRPLMEKYGARCTPREFYDAVNVHFHAAESHVYDKVHREMWQTLPRQFSLLSTDALPFPSKKLHVLDIGSGTGLSAQLFLATTLGSQTAEIQLLDTSKEMLKRAVIRSSGWSPAVETCCGSIFDLPRSKKFDVIIACSLLHHIADLTGFLNRVSLHQEKGGLFFHLHDQNADYAHDPEYLSRMAACREEHARDTRSSLLPGFIGRFYDSLFWKIVKRHNYIAQTNNSLIRAGVIERKMTELDIWRITDIRISPSTNGVSLQEMAESLPKYDLMSSRSYAFYGETGDTLPIPFQDRENELIERRAQNGHLIGGVWKKRES